MRILIALPILSLLLILQSAIFSRILLIHGMADLVMLAIIAWSLQKSVRSAWQWCIIGGLLVSFVSAIPYGLPLLGYLVVTGITLLIRQQVRQVTIIVMFISTTIGTVLTQIIDLIGMRILGINISIINAINLVTVPSLILNLLLAIPFYAILADLARLLYPVELEV